MAIESEPEKDDHKAMDIVINKSFKRTVQCQSCFDYYLAEHYLKNHKCETYDCPMDGCGRLFVSDWGYMAHIAYIHNTCMKCEVIIPSPHTRSYTATLSTFMGRPKT